MLIVDIEKDETRASFTKQNKGTLVLPVDTADDVHNFIREMGYSCDLIEGTSTDYLCMPTLGPSVVDGHTHLKYVKEDIDDDEADEKDVDEELQKLEAELERLRKKKAKNEQGATGWWPF